MISLLLSHRILEAFRGEFYPESDLGYVIGVRDAKPNLHAVVTLFPTVGEGRLLRVTTNPLDRRGQDPFLFTRKMAEREYDGFIRARFPENYNGYSEAQGEVESLTD